MSTLSFYCQVLKKWHETFFAVNMLIMHVICHLHRCTRDVS